MSFFFNCLQSQQGLKGFLEDMVLGAGAPICPHKSKRRLSPVAPHLRPTASAVFVADGEGVDALVTEWDLVISLGVVMGG